MFVIELANILIIFAIAFVLWKKQPPELSHYYWPAFVFKVACGLMLGVLYKYYYKEGDTFFYLYDGITLANTARVDPSSYISLLWEIKPSDPILESLVIQQPRAIFLTKIVSIFCLLTHDNYWLIATYFSLVNFFTGWWLAKEIVAFRDDAVAAAVVALHFFPSIVFWSAGLVKESLAMAAVYLTVVVFLKLWQRKPVSVLWWMMLIVCGWWLWSLKYYYLAVLAPVLTTALAFRWVEQKWLSTSTVYVKVLVWTLIFFIPLSTASLVHPNFYPERFLQVIKENHDAFVALSDPGDFIHYSKLEATPESVLYNSPKALFSGVLRPGLWEVRNSVQVAAAVENAVIAMLLVTALWSWWRRRHDHGDTWIAWHIGLYCILLCIFLALATPNFGTLSRYRVGFLPFLVMLLMYRNDAMTAVLQWTRTKAPFLFRSP
jgi:hypothetical protein